MNVDLCYLLCCGIPASGKTRLARMLCFSEAEIGLNTFPVSFIHVCYDDLVNSISYEQNANKSWKEQRRSCISCVEYLTRNLLDTSSSDSNTMHCNFCLHTTIATSRICKKLGAKTIFLIDDTMHLRSMRYQYFQLARKYCVGFAIAYLVVAIDDALILNNDRHGKDRIDPEMIKRMEARFEAPRSDTWEANMVQICWKEKDEAQVIKLVMEVVKKGLCHPVVSSVAQEETQQHQASKMVCANSIVHQADLLLRQLTSHLIAQKISTQETNSFDAKHFATLVVNIKLKTLQGVRDHVQQLQIEEKEGSGLDTTCATHKDYFAAFVKDLFLMHLGEENIAF